MPKFIVDECTGMAVVYFLRQQGYDTIAVSEIMPQAIDVDILRRAVAEERIVVTNDKDFGDMVYRDKRVHAGVLLLRLGDDRAEVKVRMVAAVLADHIDELANSFVVVTEQNIRIRPMRR